jgi:DNA repair exonuclease SbcCD ATPase subunit
MKIKSISWKNFGSYGNNTQKLVFDEQQGNFYLVVGSNGAGKSTVSDVIKFGLYGKLDNKKLADIPNRFNKNAFVQIIVEKNPTTIVTIERGIAPSVFNLFVNGIPYDQAGKKNMQEFLEDEILGIPYYVFNNMISLSINDFKSFISMRVHDKRMIIDRLFGLEIIGAIKWKVKYQIKLLKEQADSLLTEISVLEQTIKKSNSEMEILNEKLKIAGEEKKTELIDQGVKLAAFIKKAGEHLEVIEEKDKDLKDSIDSWNKTLYGLQSECKHRTEKIDLFEKGKCPTCESDLTTTYHQNLLQDYLNANESAKSEIDDIKEMHKELSEKKTKLKTMYDDVNKKKLTASAQSTLVKDELAKLNSAVNFDEQTSSLQNIITDSETKKNDAAVKKDIEERKANFYKIVEDVFGDKGIKLAAIKRILPLLNVEIKKVLTDLNMDYRVIFNEEFEVDIQHLGFNVSPDQLSTGERKKVDFAALIALIRLMKMKFAGVNMIFLDEIFSSIDSDGIYHILKVLHKTCRELNLNIFVINHSQLPTEIFDYRMEISKNNGFSNLNVEKIQ